jgi:RNA polymerase sigma-70 factor, ECF subfamily
VTIRNGSGEASPFLPVSAKNPRRQLQFAGKLTVQVIGGLTRIVARMTSSLHDAHSRELLVLARLGDESALGDLLAVYRHYLGAVARSQVGRRLQSKADAADLVQETFLEAHRHFGTFRGTTEAEFSSWLRAILAGLIANHVRRYLGAKRRDARLERTWAIVREDASDAFDRGIPADIASPSKQAVARESTTRLARALELLPAHYRHVITLRHFDGLPFAQVAAEMGRSVESVEKLWIRALAQLRQVLGE